MRLALCLTLASCLPAGCASAPKPDRPSAHRTAWEAVSAWLDVCPGPRELADVAASPDAAVVVGSLALLALGAVYVVAAVQHRGGGIGPPVGL